MCCSPKVLQEWVLESLDSLTFELKSDACSPESLWFGRLWGRTCNVDKWNCGGSGKTTSECLGVASSECLRREPGSVLADCSRVKSAPACHVVRSCKFRWALVWNLRKKLATRCTSLPYSQIISWSCTRDSLKNELNDILLGKVSSSTLPPWML